MNYSDLFLKISFTFIIVRYVVKDTCLLQNHNFVIVNKRVFCKKCGLIKETIKK